MTRLTNISFKCAICAKEEDLVDNPTDLYTDLVDTLWVTFHNIYGHHHLCARCFKAEFKQEPAPKAEESTTVGGPGHLFTVMTDCVTKETDFVMRLKPIKREET
jgi:hypothetical protein